MVDLTLLGTGGCMPLPDRNLSAAFFNYKGHKILIDCGEGTQVSMKKARTGFKNIDVICITHWHGDHIIGLPGILSTIGNSGRLEPITLIGPVGIKNIVDSMRIIVPYLPYDLNIIECEEAEIGFKCTNEGLIVINDENKDIKISTMKAEHSIPCIAYRFDIIRKAKFDVEKAIKNNVPKGIWSSLQKNDSVEFEGKVYKNDMVLGEERKGIRISFITDTRPLKEMISFIENSDLFICEGTYGKNEDLEKAIKNKHMVFAEAAKLAKEANVKELLLTHFGGAMENPMEYIDSAKDIFENTCIGIDRMEKTIQFEN